MIGMRFVAGIVVFFIPNIVRAVFSLSDALNIINGNKSCANCLLSPTDSGRCNVLED